MISGLRGSWEPSLTTVSVPRSPRPYSNRTLGDPKMSKKTPDEMMAGPIPAYYGNELERPEPRQIFRV
jgi:hypothetical protein